MSEKCLTTIGIKSIVDTENDQESAVLFYRLGLILPVHVTVEEYRSQSPVTQNKWSRDDPPYYLEGGDKTLVLGDLSVVGLTEFGEKFCKAVIGDVSGVYEPPSWAKERAQHGSDTQVTGDPQQPFRKRPQTMSGAEEQETLPLS
jgi:hypothetical protein